MSDIFAEPAKKPFDERFVKLLAETGREGMQELIEWLVDETDFFTAPASTRFHGAVEGGLVAHSLAVYDSLVKIADQFFAEYKTETLVIVALLHDLCKVNIYQKVMKSKKDGFLPNGKIKWIDVEGWDIDDQYPYGHGEKSVDIIRDFIELTKEERMAIRWHMGGFDDAARQYGGAMTMSAAMGKYPLIVALHMADLAASWFEGK